MNQNLNMEIKLPKVPEIELLAIEGLEKMGKHLGISEDKIGEARVVVMEAVINALEHTSDHNPFVKVEFKGLRVQKLFVGVSVVWSMLVKLLTVKLFPLPDASAPREPEFSKSK